MNILMIGFNISLLESLDRYDHPYFVTVIEEPDLYRNKNLRNIHSAVSNKFCFQSINNPLPVWRL